MILHRVGRGQQYRCKHYPRCRGKVIVYRDGTRGFQADKGTRKARAYLHNIFDRLWKSSRMTRAKAYEWLAAGLGLTECQTHIGKFSKQRCSTAIFLVRIFLEKMKRAGKFV